MLLDPLELRWISDFGGEFDDGTNWDYVMPPTEITNVFIEPEIGMIVEGPHHATVMHSLRIDARSNGVATLALGNPVPLHVVSLLNIGSRGKLTASPRIGSVPVTVGDYLTNRGQIDLGSENLEIGGTGTLVNYGSVRGSGLVDLTLQNFPGGEVWGEAGARLRFGRFEHLNWGGPDRCLRRRGGV